MSTYFAFRNPMTKQELENIGVNFDDDNYIVDENNENELETAIYGDDVYGFTRYAMDDADYILDILYDNGIEWADSYELNDSDEEGFRDIADHLGLEYDNIVEHIGSEWVSDDYYWSDDKEEFITEWCQQNKQLFQ